MAKRPDEYKQIELSVQEALEKFTNIRETLTNDRHDDRNHEHIDPRPMAVAVKYRRPPTLKEQMDQFMRSKELRELAMDNNIETFDQAEDFEVGEADPLARFFDTPTPFEEEFEGQFEQTADEIRRTVDERVREAKAAKAAKDKADREAMDEVIRSRKVNKNVVKNESNDDED